FVRRSSAMPPLDAARAVLDVINGRRRAAHAPAVGRDRTLDQVAQDFSQAVVAGRAARSDGQQATRQAMTVTGGHYRQLATLFTVMPEPSRLPDSDLLVARGLTAVGIGVALGDSSELGPGSLFVTVLLGVR